MIGVLRAPGTSPDESAAMNTKIEKLLVEKFPDEVRHVWSRVGTPEVATDAGSVEVTDVFVSLKPREEWKKARTQAELVDLMLPEVEQMKGPDYGLLSRSNNESTRWSPAFARILLSSFLVTISRH